MPDWDNTPPVARDLSSPGDNTAPTAIAVGAALTDSPAVPIGAPSVAYITMPASFQPAFLEVSGGGPTLKTLNATAADIGKLVQGLVASQLKTYEVCAGTDAEDLPGIVHPANYDADANPVVFVQR
jgi:hypothetical protein